jgi:hypothetical protein
MASYCFHIRGQASKGVQSVKHFFIQFYPEDEGNEMSINIYPVTWRHISADFNFQRHRCEAAKSGNKIFSNLTTFSRFVVKETN